jgi:hypothetical protein
VTRRLVWLWSVGFARAGGRLLQPFIDVIEAAGLSTPEPVDLGTALWTGLASQQISKDPVASGGAGSSSGPSTCSSTGLRLRNPIEPAKLVR